jgi:hypothetical protein
MSWLVRLLPLVFHNVIRACYKLPQKLDHRLSDSDTSVRSNYILLKVLEICSQ